MPDQTPAPDRRSKPLKMSTRLVGAFGLMATLLAVVMSVALLGMDAMRASAREINTNWVTARGWLAQMNTAQSDFRDSEFLHILTTDGSGMAAVEQRLADKLATFEQARDSYVKTINAPEERKLYDGFATLWKDYLRVNERVIDLSRSNEKDAAKALMVGESKTVYDAAEAALSRDIDFNHKRATAEGESTDRAYVVAHVAMVVSGIVCISLALTLGIGLVRGIRRELGGEPADVASKRANAESGVIAPAPIAQGNLDPSHRSGEQASSLEDTAAAMAELGITVLQNADDAALADRLSLGASTVAVHGSHVVGRS